MTEITTSAFLNKGGVQQFVHILKLYPSALRIKSETKTKPQELIKLDEWYQTALPKALKSRKPSYLKHDELINIIKWKQSRGKFRPKLKELVTMNSPRCVEAESKKAFRALEKKGDLSVAVAYLCNLKGIGPSTASAILTAYTPETAAFMADECLAAVPEIEGIDCSTREYLDLMRHLRDACARLSTTSQKWTPHDVEKALWTHYTLLMLKPELLQSTPVKDIVEVVSAGEDSNSVDSRGLTDEEGHSLHGTASGLMNGSASHTKHGPSSAQDMYDESSHLTSEEPNSNSPLNLKNEESDTGSSPKPYNSLITSGLDDEDGNAQTDVTVNYCNSKVHEHEAYEPDRKRVKVD